jgi:uncharacterized protein
MDRSLIPVHMVVPAGHRNANKCIIIKEKKPPKADTLDAAWLVLNAERYRDATSCHLVGDMYFAGVLGVQNPKVALYWYLQAACSSCPTSAYMETEYKIGCLYMDFEEQGIKPNPVKALKYYKIAAEKGDLNACFEVGNMYIHGLGAPTNWDNAYLYLGKAAKGGHQEAAEMLQALLDTMSGYIQGLEKEAAEEDVETMTVLGEAYLGDTGLSKDLTKAHYYLTEAAKRGSLSAAFHLAGLLLDDSSGFTDNDKACDWLAYAVAKEYPPAQQWAQAVIRDFPALGKQLSEQIQIQKQLNLTPA